MLNCFIISDCALHADLTDHTHLANHADQADHDDHDEHANCCYSCEDYTSASMS